jgi:hypothetical protein
VIGVGCGSDDPSGETAVLGAEVERTPTAAPTPRRLVAESTDRAAPKAPADALRIGGVRIAAESTDRLGPADSGLASEVVGDRYAGQAAAYAAGNVEPDRPIRVNGGRTED